MVIEIEKTLEVEAQEMEHSQFKSENDMRLGDGGTEVGVFRYIGVINFYQFFFLSQFWPNLDQNYINIKLKIRAT